jgi:ABC-2 type transport system permease protein
MITELKQLIDYREFLRQYVQQMLHSRYRGSVLGFLWSLLNPLFICITFSVLFSSISGQPLHTYGVFFFSGYMPWTFFVSAVGGAIMSVVGNSHYVTRIYVPKTIFPLSVALVSFIDLLVAMPILFGVMIVSGAPLTPALLILPLSLLFLLLFTAGLCFLFASINVFLRDFSHLWTSLSFLWFFFSPILYPLEKVPAYVRPLLEANPIVPFLRMFQDPVSRGVFPDPGTILIAGVGSAIVAVVGFTVFTRSQKLFYLYL